MATANWKRCCDDMPDRYGNYLAEIQGVDGAQMVYYGIPHNFHETDWFVYSEHTEHFQPVRVIRWDYVPSL